MIMRKLRARAFVLHLMLIGTLLLALPLSAQQNPPSSDTTSPAQSKPEDKNGAKNDPPIQEQKSPNQAQSPQNDRLFFLLPNYLTVENSGKIPPLTTGQKFKLVALGTFDPVEFPYVGILAGIDQAENEDPSYGQGFKGYAKRYGVAFADTTVENFMVGAVIPSILHEDPRYFQSGKGGFWHRFGYAASRMILTHRLRENPVQLLRVGRQRSGCSHLRHLSSGAGPQCRQRGQRLGEPVMGRCTLL